jgi:hypothetical protein
MSALKPAIKFLLNYFIGNLNNNKQEAPQNLTKVYVTLLSGVGQWLVHHLVYSAPGPLSWRRERGRFLMWFQMFCFAFLVQCLDTKLRVALPLFWLYCLSWRLLLCVFNRKRLATAHSFVIRFYVDRGIFIRHVERNGSLKLYGNIYSRDIHR